MRPMVPFWPCREENLSPTLGVRTVRVSFCGYRDWGERNSPHAPRVVPVDFVPMEDVGQIVDVLRREL